MSSAQDQTEANQSGRATAGAGRDNRREAQGYRQESAYQGGGDAGYDGGTGVAQTGFTVLAATLMILSGLLDHEADEVTLAFAPLRERRRLTIVLRLQQRVTGGEHAAIHFAHIGDHRSDRELEAAGIDATGAVDWHFGIAMAAGLVWRSVWVASTCSTSVVPMPKASAPNAPCVEVWLSPQTTVMPGWVSPSSGPIT